MQRSAGEAAQVRELAERLAREAGRIQRERYESSFEIRKKSGASDLVTEVDHACEALIVEALDDLRPGDAILAEEGSGSDRADAPWRWIVDPLDGTTNFAHGYPRFCVSIGVEHEGVRTIGVVYDPLRDELFSALRGHGATCNGDPIAVSPETQLGEALIGMGTSYDTRRSFEENMARILALARGSRATRRDGSAALDLCCVAAGRFDGYWELNLKAWDVAAGFLLVEEAGGRVSALDGGPAPASGEEVLASNGRIHDALLEILRNSSDA